MIFKATFLYTVKTQQPNKHVICYGVAVCLACEIDIDHKSILLCCIYEIFNYDQVSWFMRAYYIHESIFTRTSEVMEGTLKTDPDQVGGRT